MAGCDSITLKYDLHELPTAQHKAGLAGLLLMIESMKKRNLSLLPEIKELDAAGATVVFTKDSMQAMFDDYYDALLIEVERKNKWPSQSPTKIEKVTVQLEDGNTKEENRYFYDLFQPAGKYLTVFYPDDGNGPWIKLWREMLWGTLRGIPKTRNAYQERLDKNPSSVAEKTWSQLCKAEEGKRKGETLTGSLSSALFVGAQDSNAEKVPFVGTVEQNLLLHFWTLASLYYVPQVLKRDGGREYKGYVIVIPELVDLVMFLEDIKKLFESLNTDVSGYRPSESIIDLPEEGGLEYLYHLARYKVKQADVSFSIASVELYHLHKQGNNIRLLLSGSIKIDKAVLEDYSNLRGEYSNPLYKLMRINNILSGNLWYTGAEELFSVWPRELFIRMPEDKKTYIFFFGGDVYKKFRAIEDDNKLKGGINLAEHNDDKLALQVYRLIRSYVNYKAEAKSGKRYEDFKDNKDDKGRVKYPKEYSEVRSRLCLDAFLAMRGRREQNFVEYFTGTICSVPHFLPEEDFLSVSQALLNDWDKVKTLSMLALSAQSYTVKTSEEGGL